MSTPISICSNALLKLGSRTISSFTDATDTATLCSNIYPEARDSLLRSHLWNFAVKRTNIASEITVPAYQYANSHPLPADCLRLLEVYNIDDFVLESNRILCDSTPVYIQYVYRNVDTATYDTLFIELLTQKMVAELAYAVTRSDSKAQSEFQKFSVLLRQARSIDGLEQPGGQFKSFPLIEARY
jgi:hypothetical protein